MIDLSKGLDNLESAFYRKIINIEEEDFKQTFDNWVDSLSLSEFLFQLKQHGYGE